MQRDSWMTDAPGFFPCTSRAELREQKRKEKEEREVALMDQVITSYMNNTKKSPTQLTAIFQIYLKLNAKLVDCQEELN